ncbi:MAG: NAD-dependent epimerase/dehydratase family protein [Gemmatimonadetes bacterium]|nr:NAD-dependent epimerase/dehydratase family protein [Gemmatimonadota bacterium]
MPDLVLITGGAGFIGSHLADALLRRGERVVVVDNLCRRGSEHNLRWLVARHSKRLQVEVVDVRDSRGVQRLIERVGTVYHLAGQHPGPSRLAEPAHDFRVNVEGTRNVLESAGRMGDPPAIVFASTSEVYGELVGRAVAEEGGRYVLGGGQGSVSEDQPLDYSSLHGYAKASAEACLEELARRHKLATCVVRMSCVYGPRQLGNEDQGWLASLACAALAGQPVTLYGDGRDVRDLLYIDDAVEALIRTARAARERPGRTYNLGGGPSQAVSMFELLEWFEQDLGRPIQRVFHPRRPGEPRVYVTDLTRITRELGWWPAVPRELGLPRLVAWLRTGPAGIPHRLADARQPLPA